SNGQHVWHAARLLQQLAAYPADAVVSRISALFEHWNPSDFGAYLRIEACLTVGPAGRSILDAIDCGAALGSFDQGWGAQRLQAAGEHTAATELAMHAIRSSYGSRDTYKQAASVLLKADQTAAISQLIILAKQNPQSIWLAGVMDALDSRDQETDSAADFCARRLVAHPRADGKELRDALSALLVLQGESAVQSVAEATQTRPELRFDQRRELVRELAALGRLDLAQSVWAHLLTWQEYGITEDVSMVEDFLNAGVEQWAAERIRELIDDPATAPLRAQRLRQMLAWLTAAPSQSARVEVRNPSP
ncbi:MAG: hypothetical protein ACRDRS_22835, partial [Pseudonocardiaceae bacterium]